MKSACFFGQKSSNGERSAGVSSALLFAVVFLFIAFILLSLPVNKMIMISNQKTSDILFTLPVKNGEVLDVQFTHSVNLSPVIDRYQIDGTALVLQSTIFKTYGAGIPVLDDGLGKSFSQTEEGFEISGIDLPRDGIPIMLQTVPDHRIVYRKRNIHLLDFAKSGTVIEITVGSVSFMKRFFTQLKTP